MDRFPSKERDLLFVHSPKTNSKPHRGLKVIHFHGLQAEECVELYYYSPIRFMVLCVIKHTATLNFAYLICI